MGRRYINSRLQTAHADFYSTWGNKPRMGKFWKRLWSKKIRKFGVTELHDRGISGLRSTINWRNW